MICFLTHNVMLTSPELRCSSLPCMYEHLVWSSASNNTSVVANTHTPTTWEVEAGGSEIQGCRAWWCTPLIPALRRQMDFWVRGQPGLQSELQDSQGYTEKPCLEKPKKKRKETGFSCHRGSDRVRGGIQKHTEMGSWEEAGRHTPAN
jgi:hypothetical protein